eukprot:3130983-Prymnesium_polylepis.1
MPPPTTSCDRPTKAHDDCNEQQHGRWASHIGAQSAPRRPMSRAKSAAPMPGGPWRSARFRGTGSQRACGRSA